ncbi:hypothetical protein ACFOWZ_31620 [Lentzea rhizosphaerae]|uniref:Uncharacterized protein n=1 Tax=Lentzea rhizosphaerae TaxID=2041025 RepID=A0ABV8C237_9PSEU
MDDELIVRVEGGGWAPATTGDLSELVERSAEIVIAECVVRWHAELRAGDPVEASRAMLALVRHDPEREQLQRLLLDLTRHPQLGQLAVTCLGHVARNDGSVLPEVVPHLQKLGVCAEDALEDIEIFTTRSGCGGTRRRG